MADALALVGHPIIHVVSALPHRAGPLAGQCNATDAEIAEWCAKTENVLVTSDSDFRGRWVRNGLLVKHGVEVVAFDKDVAGLIEQHRRVTRHMPYWHDTLNRQPYSHRVWIQTSKLAPSLSIGRQKRKRSRV